MDGTASASGELATGPVVGFHMTPRANGHAIKERGLVVEKCGATYWMRIQEGAPGLFFAPSIEDAEGWAFAIYRATEECEFLLLAVDLTSLPCAARVADIGLPEIEVASDVASDRILWTRDVDIHSLSSPLYRGRVATWDAFHDTRYS